MANEVNGYHCPEPTIVYDPSLDILEISNGEASATSEEFASGVIVYYDKDGNAQSAEEPAFAVAVRFLDAEKILKPFVDAVLQRYGIEPHALNANMQASKRTVELTE